MIMVAPQVPEGKDTNRGYVLYIKSKRCRRRKGGT